jgi:hypothetical protein
MPETEITDFKDLISPCDKSLNPSCLVAQLLLLNRQEEQSIKFRLRYNSTSC